MLQYDEALRDYIRGLRLATGVKDEMTADIANRFTREIGEAFKEIGKILDKKRMPVVSILALKMAYCTKRIDSANNALNHSDRVELPLMIEKIRAGHRGTPSQISDPIRYSSKAPVHEDKESVEAKMAQINSRLLGVGKSEGVVVICDELLNPSSNNARRPLSTLEHAEVLLQKAEALRKLSNSSKGNALKQKKSKEALACHEEARRLLKDYLVDENEEKAKEAEDEVDKLSPNQGSKKRKPETEAEIETDTDTEAETEENEQSESKKVRIRKPTKRIPFLPSENKDPNESCQEPSLKKHRFVIKKKGGRIWRFE